MNSNEDFKLLDDVYKVTMLKNFLPNACKTLWQTRVEFFLFPK
jgi:hypothetical protein